MGSTDGNSTDSLKWITGAVAIAAAAFALAGLGGAELGRLTKLHPLVVTLGLIAIVLAALAGVVGLMVHEGTLRKWIVVAGLAFFLGGVAGLVWYYADSVSSQDRPTASVDLVRQDDHLAAKLKITAGGLKPTDYLFVVVQGSNSSTRLNPVTPGRAEDTTPIPPDEYSKQRIYKGRIGPSLEGDVDVSMEVALSDGFYEQIVVMARVISNGPEALGEEGEIENGEAGTGRFKCDGQSADISCATVLVPLQPAGDGDPPVSGGGTP